jgi:hypothetical protein
MNIQQNKKFSFTDFLISAFCSSTSDPVKCIRTTVGIGWFIVWILISMVLINSAHQNKYMWLIGWSVSAFIFYYMHVTQILWYNADYITVSSV